MLRTVCEVFSARGGLWSCLAGSLVSLVLAAAIWAWFPTTTSYSPSSAPFMPLQVSEFAKDAAGLSVAVDPRAGTLTLTRPGEEDRSLVVPASLLPDAVLLLASAGADVSWPASESAFALAAQGSATVQVDSPMLGFFRWILLSGCLMMATAFAVVGVRRRRMGERWSSGPRKEAVPATRFSDVAGAVEAVEDLREVVRYLKDPAALTALGASPPRGILLVGPPGTGKTLLARAVAGEAGASFFAATGSDFMEKYVGVGASRVRALFAQARKNAPAIVFIDEIDAVGKSRSDSDEGHSAESDHTLVSLLTEVDGFLPRDRVVVIGATNRPEVLDPALTRSGRLERRIEVPLPDRRGRLQILRVTSAGVPWGGEVDLELLSARTPGFSGAQLRHLVNEAALQAVRRGAQCVDGRDVDAALAEVTVGRARHSALVTDRDRLVTAWHEAGHASAALLLADAPDPVAASIVPRGPAGGVTWMSEPEEAFFTRSAIQARMVVAMAGRSAEKMLLDGDFTQGSAHDVEESTRLAEAMVARFAMTESVPAKRRLAAHGSWSQDVVDEVDALLRAAQVAADGLLGRHADLVSALVAELLENEDLSAQDLIRLRSAFGVEPVRVDFSDPSRTREV